MKGASRKPMVLLGLLLALVLGVGGRALAADTALTITGAETMVGGVWDTGALTISFTDSTGNSYSETAGGPGPSHLGTGDGRHAAQTASGWSILAVYERQAHPLSADGGVPLPHLQLLSSPALPVDSCGHGAF